MNSVYDPALWDSMPPANVRGGKSRAIKAQRDLLGRFMPNNPADWPSWVLDSDHGKAGGNALLDKKGRGYFKELAKRRRQNVSR